MTESNRSSGEVAIVWLVLGVMVSIVLSALKLYGVVSLSWLFVILVPILVGAAFATFSSNVVGWIVDV